MMRVAVKKASQEVPVGVVAQTRSYFALPKADFSEEVVVPKAAAKDGVSVLEDWKAKKAGTEQLLKLLQTYKDLGDNKAEPYLKFHNPRTFEDLSKPVPNFRAMNLKAGEVPKFFDSVLVRRAEESVEQKSKWWAQRKKEAEDSLKGKSFQPFSTVPVPEWKYGKSVSLKSLQAATDGYIKAQEPKRKLKVPQLPAEVKASLAAFTKEIKQEASLPEVQAQLVASLADKAVVEEKGKVLDGFKYVSKAVAAKVVAQRRAEVHDKYVKYWAKKVIVSPESAVVPLKDVDYQLASKFEGVAPQYAELLSSVASGSKTLGERIAASPAFSTFLFKREKVEDVKAEFPASDADKEGAALAAKLEDPAAALEALLGPEGKALGAAGVPLSAQVRAITAHRYAPDRYFYKEGMKLADKLEEEEKALAAELKGAYGENVDVAKFQVAPRTVLQQLADREKELAAKAGEFAEAAKAAATPYCQYATAKKQEFLKDPSNIAFEEVLYPELVQESLDVELAELREQELAIDDAEEEELWALTLTAQLKHLQKHFGVDLPHSVLAYMDPILVKKIDFETTQGLDDWDAVLEDMGSEYAKEQWGVENLSHHFLPLIRYRRMKARKQGAKFDNETASVVRH